MFDLKSDYCFIHGNSFILSSIFSFSFGFLPLSVYLKSPHYHCILTRIHIHHPLSRLWCIRRLSVTGQVEYYQKAFGFLSGFLFAWQVIHPSKSFYFVRAQMWPNRFLSSKASSVV
ncbi:uncharacterized protein BYT42DRAFT_387968 [Radiomyces spectabilis]|uniref:uncharacterized protein n=1 Tax=Radiomyces spectabilis TaxID=64574 RepID=UPI00221EDDAE|nr:uncharacterized protein BYT42DRAFT_211851 [Radiomyces spectabilis]XP_051422599.1 uncharacterized protein BYT42DRAFT_387968 [Radiomyces spectabilis]KAI8364355.1 hypothetical protein BYT42DRAFT_211851 [Radiomyces spectabilis]KAI8376474.1 hypothetical protein BYT42DRAFT_387968 [Radiomyces spectabilis]